MKKQLIIGIFIFLNITGNAQTDCQNNVSTDYTAPYNDALPSNPDGYRYLNGLDWFPVDELGYYSQYDLTNMEFDGVSLDNMVNIMSLSYSEYSYITDGPLPIGINGWELLLVNLGRYPDDLTPVPYDDIDHLPYIVLYNRYSGTIRVFVNFGEDHVVGGGANAIQMMLRFQAGSNVSGILRVNDGADRTLDQKTKVVSITSVAIAPATANQWSSTDFQVAYDPCSCYYPTDLRLDFEQITSSTLELHGRSITLEDVELLGDDLTIENPENYLTGFDYTGGTANGGGMMMHKTIVKLLEDYIVELDSFNTELIEAHEHNKRVKTNLAILKLAKTAAYLYLNPIGGAVPTGVSLALNAQSIAELEAAELPVDKLQDLYQGLGPDITDWYQAAKKGVTGLIDANEAGQDIIDEDKLFKLVKQILGDKGDAFIANNFELKEVPSAPAIPKATFSEMHYQGKVETSLGLGGIRFYSPGTYGSEGTGTPPVPQVYRYPIYNEVLGLFALLESPKIKISETLVDDVEHNIYNHGAPFGANYVIQSRRYQSWTKEYQIRLAESLKFAINDVPDVADYHIEAAFKIKAIPKDNGIPEGGRMNLFHDSVTCVNVSSINTTIDADSGYTDIRTREKEYHSLYNNPFTSHGIVTFDDSAPLTYVRDTVEIITETIPLDAFMPFVVGMGIRNEYINYEDHSFPWHELENYPLESGEILEDFDDDAPPYVFDLDNDLIEIPDSLDPVLEGYEYEFIVELKLFVDIEFETLNEAGYPNSITMSLTYEVDEDDITYQTYDLVDDLTNTTKNIGKYPETIVFEDLDFHGQEVDDCELEGSTYTCQARNDILVNGNLSTSSGYEVNLFAGDIIEVVNESTVSPEIILEINPVYDYSYPIPKVDQTYVRNFCKGVGEDAPDYKANSSTKTAIDSTAETLDIREQQQEDFFSFTLFPNPTNETAYLKLNQVNAEVSISVRGMTGQEVFSAIQNGRDDVYTIDCSAWAAGVYFVTVSANGMTKTKRLIIQ